jgi:4a-hydroxytetrahydrobiopterin dehydratase
MEPMPRLGDEEVAAALAPMSGWQQLPGAIRKIYEFASFADGMKFVKRVADLAEAANHHPDLLVQYRRVTVTLSSHDASGITERDIRLARRIDG